MPTLKYFTRTQKKDIFAPLYVRVYESKKIDISVKTETRVLPLHWNPKKQKFNESIRYSNSFTKNDSLDIEDVLNDLRNRILKDYNNRVVTGQPITRKWLEDVCKKFYNKSSTEINLNSYIDVFIKDCEDGKKLSNQKGEKKKYAPGTIKNFKSSFAQIIEFQIYTDRIYDFNDITIDFYNDFVAFFLKKNYSPNTIGRIIRNLKLFVRTAMNEGLHSNTQIDLKAFKAPKIEVDNIYLNENELKLLYNLDLHDKPNYEIARDVFLIGCYTAQRFSDYSSINKDNIRMMSNGIKAIFLIQKKTNEKVIIPIKQELNILLEKYCYNVPHIWEQKLNKYIKKVGEIAKISERVTIESMRGGLKVSITKPKHDLIKTHTARRSGCTNMYLAGIPAIDIMKISGHKTPTEFLKYIKVGKEETAQNLMTHEYFTHSKLKLIK